MKLLSRNNLACIQGTEELGAVGTDLGGEWGEEAEVCEKKVKLVGLL